jgi:hypothetical protein
VLYLVPFTLFVPKRFRWDIYQALICQITKSKKLYLSPKAIIKNFFQSHMAACDMVKISKSAGFGPAWGLGNTYVRCDK